MLLQAIVLIACPVFLALGAVTDLVSYRIPNWIPGALIALFAIAVPLAGMPLDQAGLHVLVFTGALLFGMALFAFNLVGGGDAKFFAAIALWMGPAVILKYFVVFALTGGAFAILLLMLRRFALPAFTARISFINQLMLPTAGMPYGVALGIGALIVLPSTYLAVAALAP